LRFSDELLKLPKTISTKEVQDIIAHFRKLGQLHPKSATSLTYQAQQILEPRPALVELRATADSKLTVVGNLCGQFFDLLQIFDLNGMPSPKNRYLFNGGYFGYGWFGLEVLFTLFAIEVAQPGSVFFNGSFLGDDDPITARLDLLNEVRWKYRNGNDDDDSTHVDAIRAVDQFSLAHIVQDSIFVAHGGAPCAAASNRVYDKEYLRALPKHPRFPDFAFMKGEEELESDEIRRILLTGASPLLSGQVDAFLKTNRLKQIIRSNEPFIPGVKKSADGSILTLSSAPRGHNTLGERSFALKTQHR
jgi:serine/threonine-protein phosphatase 5